MIIDENKIKEYVNYHDWVNSPNEWHELWNTSVSVRGILLENITNEEIVEGIGLYERIEQEATPLLCYAGFTSYILVFYKITDSKIWYRWFFDKDYNLPSDGRDMLMGEILDSLRNFTDNVKGKWGDDFKYIRDINDGANTQIGLNLLVVIGFSVDITTTNIEELNMEKFEVNILGCGAAIPIGRHMTTSQLVNVHDKLFMVDCGEGTQTQIWKSGIKLTNMDNIFISHAHGDHFFGLVPLLSSLNLMLGRTKDINVFVPEDLKDILMLMLKELCHIPFNVNINTFMGNSNQKIYEDEEMEIETIPLKHGIPCCGFLFREKPKKRVLLPEKCLSYDIPKRDFKLIKNGNDYILPDGTLISNKELTAPSEFVPRSYAYCSDTAYNPSMVSQLKDVDLLYHETTFLANDENRAINAFHSTTHQAANIAKSANARKLIIGHYSIRYDDEQQFEQEVKSIFPNAEACNEGMVFSV